MNGTLIVFLGMLFGSLLTFLGHHIFYKLNKNKFIYNAYQKEIERKDKYLHEEYALINRMQNENKFGSAYSEEEMNVEFEKSYLLEKQIEILSKMALDFADS